MDTMELSYDITREIRLMYYGNYRDDQYARAKTPREACKDTLINLRFEQRKPEPDPDRLTEYHRDISQYQIPDLIAAFDAIVDEGGW